MVWDDGTVASVAGTPSVDGAADDDTEYGVGFPSAASAVWPSPDPTREGGLGASVPGPGGALSGGGIFKHAAVEVLRVERRLMTTGEIAKLALQRGYVRATGKTPEATMASALYTDVKRREGTSVFIRPHEGLFGLREWVEQGIPFRDDYAEELARRAAATYGPYSALAALTLPHGAPLLPLGHVTPLTGMPLGAGAAGLACDGIASPPGDKGREPGGLMELLNAAEELQRSPSSSPVADGAQKPRVGEVAHSSGDSPPLAMTAQGEGLVNGNGDPLSLPIDGATAVRAGVDSDPSVPPAGRPSQPQGRADAIVPGEGTDWRVAPGELTVALRRAETRVLALERALGPLHFAVGRALIDVARLYTQRSELDPDIQAVSTARMLADAALVRASRIMRAWQEALGRSSETTDAAFTSLLGLGTRGYVCREEATAAPADGNPTSEPGTDDDDKGDKQVCAALATPDRPKEEAP